MLKRRAGSSAARCVAAVAGSLLVLTVMLSASANAAGASAGYIGLHDSGPSVSGALHSGWAAATGAISSAPQAGALFACKSSRSLPRRFSPARARLPVANQWVTSGLSHSLLGDFRKLSSDSLPPGSGQAGLRTARFAGAVARSPGMRGGPFCVDDKQPVGVTLRGEMIFPPVAAAGSARSASAQDACGGRRAADGLYFLADSIGCVASGGQVGWARDGASIWAHAGTGLDACGGHTALITLDGRKLRRYHYHLRKGWPYTLGCFRSKPSTNWVLPRPKGLGVLRAQPVVPDPEVGTTPAPPVAPDPGVAPTPAPTAVSSVPEIVPAFNASVTDYALRCAAGQSTEFQIQLPDGVVASVNSGAGRRGQFTESVPLGYGERMRLNVNGGREYSFRCLPPDFPAYSAELTGQPQAAGYLVTPGFAFVGSSPYAVIFDSSGVPIWWYRYDAGPIDAKLLASGNVVAYVVRGGGNGAYEERTLGGAFVREMRTVGVTADFHDVQVTEAGTHLMLSYVNRDHVDLTQFGGGSDDSVLDAVIQEIAADGSLLWSWNSKDHVELSETGRWWQAAIGGGAAPWDIAHINSVEEAGDGNLVLSARHLDAVYKIDRTSGAVIWKLGGTSTSKSLEVSGTTRTGLGGQHDARVLADGTLTVHDNQTGLGAPRALRFRIDESAMTATVVEEISDSATPSSGCCGSARRLPGGNWVVEWGGNTLLAELRPDGSPVLRISHPSGLSYRAIPLLQGEIPFADVRSGMDQIAAG